LATFSAENVVTSAPQQAI
jgi:hypothetical protein